MSGQAKTWWGPLQHGTMFWLFNVRVKRNVWKANGVLSGILFSFLSKHLLLIIQLLLCCILFLLLGFSIYFCGYYVSPIYSLFNLPLNIQLFPTLSVVGSFATMHFMNNSFWYLLDGYFVSQMISFFSLLWIIRFLRECKKLVDFSWRVKQVSSETSQNKRKTTYYTPLQEEHCSPA